MQVTNYKLPGVMSKTTPSRNVPTSISVNCRKPLHLRNLLLSILSFSWSTFSTTLDSLLRLLNEAFRLSCRWLCCFRLTNLSWIRYGHAMLSCTVDWRLLRVLPIPRQVGCPEVKPAVVQGIDLKLKTFSYYDTSYQFTITCGALLTLH